MNSDRHRNRCTLVSGLKYDMLKKPTSLCIYITVTAAASLKNISTSVIMTIMNYMTIISFIIILL